MLTIKNKTKHTAVCPHALVPRASRLAPRASPLAPRPSPLAPRPSPTPLSRHADCTPLDSFPPRLASLSLRVEATLSFFFLVARIGRPSQVKSSFFLLDQGRPPTSSVPTSHRHPRARASSRARGRIAAQSTTGREYAFATCFAARCRLAPFRALRQAGGLGLPMNRKRKFLEA